MCKKKYVEKKDDNLTRNLLKNTTCFRLVNVGRKKRTPKKRESFLCHPLTPSYTIRLLR